MLTIEPPPAARHRFGDRADAEEGAELVDLEDAPVVGNGRVGDAAQEEHRRVVDEHVHGARPTRPGSSSRLRGDVAVHVASRVPIASAVACPRSLSTSATMTVAPLAANTCAILGAGAARHRRRSRSFPSSGRSPAARLMAGAPPPQSPAGCARSTRARGVPVPFPPSVAAVDHIVVAEQLGYERAWLFDSPALSRHLGHRGLAAVAHRTDWAGPGGARTQPAPPAHAGQRSRHSKSSRRVARLPRSAPASPAAWRWAADARPGRDTAALHRAGPGAPARRAGRGRRRAVQMLHGDGSARGRSRHRSWLPPTGRRVSRWPHVFGDG